MVHNCLYCSFQSSSRVSIPLQVDIANGFFCIWVIAINVPKLGVLLPVESGQERLIGFPVVLSMGCKESPLVFTSAAETVAYLANDKIQQGV
jgi:hypothetical protein